MLAAKSKGSLYVRVACSCGWVGGGLVCFNSAPVLPGHGENLGGNLLHLVPTKSMGDEYAPIEF